jgi:hypothetical protein
MITVALILFLRLFASAIEEKDHESCTSAMLGNNQS